MSRLATALGLSAGRYGSAVFVGALDDYTTGLTWLGSVKRRLLASHTGDLVTARSSAVGSPEQGIGYVADGSVDDAALATFGGSDSVYTKALINQSGSGLANLIMATEASQPRLLNAGVAEDEGGMYLDGTDDKLVISGVDILDLLGASDGQIWLRIKTNNPSNNGRIVDAAGSTGFWCPFSGAIYWDFASTTGGRISVATPAGIEGSWADISLEKEGGTSRIRVNGTVVHSGSTSDTLSSASVNFTLGDLAAGGGGMWLGWVKEIAIWNDGTAANCIARCTALA